MNNSIEVNDIHEVSKFPYTPVRGRVQKIIMVAVAQHIANKGPFNMLSVSFVALQVAWQLNKVCLLPSKLKIMV